MSDMANLLFHPDVHYEIKSSYVWYQEQAEGYRKHHESLFVVAVMHHSRKPGYWLERVRQQGK